MNSSDMEDQTSFPSKGHVTLITRKQTRKIIIMYERITDFSAVIVHIEGRER